MRYPMIKSLQELSLTLKSFPSFSSLSTLVLLLLVLPINTQANQALPSIPTIKVSAEGKVKALPDQVQIVLNFNDTQLEADDARKTVNRQVNALLKALKKFKLKEHSLDTSQTRIYPQYNYRNNNRQFVGYQFDRTVEFILSDLSQLSDVVSAITKADAAQLNQMSFGLANPAQVKDKALDRAIENAKATAKKIADSFGVSLGKIHSVDYQSSAHNAPFQQFKARAAFAEAADAAPNYEQQALEFQARINVEFTFL